ncbi:MAG: ASKHA domain-containing protein [Nitrospirota bacterium]|nr:ASKHA domain-containing protein [Nitrospirota bacterium]MDH5767667.1 ASKHA domain-containing protein [Nitrospirota bacterium]
MDIGLITGKTFDISEGENLLQALKKHGVYLVASCGGKGICGKCRVRLIKGKARIESTGILRPGEIDTGIVLACQTFPEKDILIDIPKESRLVVGEKIALSKSKDLIALLHSFNVEIHPIVRRITLNLPPPTINDNIGDFERIRRSLQEKDIIGIRFSHRVVSAMSKIIRDAGWKITLGYTGSNDIISISPADMNKNSYGLAVDIGTTTVVIYLVNLTDGQLIDVGSTYNSQTKYGDDVITRIIHATESEGLDELRDCVVSDINDLLVPLVERQKINSEDIESAVIAGNTTMSHIFWGLNPASIREEPYIPTLNYFPRWSAETAKLRLNPRAPLYTVPCVASYVGGDIVAGVLASKMHRNSEIALFMDIGTNGEIVIGNNEWLVAAACSAGPCFEGSGIRHGMRATEGAIESIKIDHRTFEPVFKVIGDGEPMGICGSGMIDAISEMFLAGIIDRKGKFVRNTKTGRIRDSVDGREFLIFSRDGNEIVLTEVDIENIIRAKAAMYAGVSVLLKEVGFGLDAIEKVYIAGGFGNYLDIDKAIILGMFPELPKNKFTILGNASISGAYLCLLSKDLRRESGIIASKMTYIELSVSRGFMDEYMSALFLPHTHLRLFPKVKQLILRSKNLGK